GTAAADGAEPRAVANWVTGELAARLREAGVEDAPSSKVEPSALASLVAMVQAKQVSHGAAREVLTELVASGGDPAEIVASKGLGQIEDRGEIDAAGERAVEANPDAAGKGKGGEPQGSRPG